jgi:hypothetical protein
VFVFVFPGIHWRLDDRSNESDCPPVEKDAKQFVDDQVNNDFVFRHAPSPPGRTWKYVPAIPRICSTIGYSRSRFGRPKLEPVMAFTDAVLEAERKEVLSRAVSEYEFVFTSLNTMAFPAGVRIRITSQTRRCQDVDTI